MFGTSASFCDSIVYFTDIQVVDSAWIDEKTNFLVNRWDYSNQLRSHFNLTGHPNRTCVVCFATSEKDIRKKYAKMRKKFTGSPKKPTRYDLRQLEEDEFKRQATPAQQQRHHRERHTSIDASPSLNSRTIISYISNKTDELIRH